MILWFANLGEEECAEHLKLFVAYVCVINLLGFNPLFYTTKEFYNRRTFYFHKNMAPSNCLRLDKKTPLLPCANNSNKVRLYPCVQKHSFLNFYLFCFSSNSVVHTALIFSSRAYEVLQRGCQWGHYFFSHS